MPLLRSNLLNARDLVHPVRLAPRLGTRHGHIQGPETLGIESDLGAISFKFIVLLCII